MAPLFGNLKCALWKILFLHVPRPRHGYEVLRRLFLILYYPRSHARSFQGESEACPLNLQVADRVGASRGAVKQTSQQSSTHHHLRLMHS